MWIDIRVVFTILWYSHNGDHPQEELANFGYRSEMNVKNLRILPYFEYVLEPIV